MKKSKPISASELPPHILELNPQLKPKTTAEICCEIQNDMVKMKVNKPERKMNKTEERFYDYLKNEYRNEPHIIIPQPTRFFRFKNGDSYTPDFIVISDCGIGVYEVKGGYRGAGWEQGYDRYYRAKEKFESQELRITFFLVTWNKKTYQWEYES